MKEQIINSEQQLNAYVEYLKKRLNDEGRIKIEVKSVNKRTLTQNASLHKYCSMLADELNDAGYDFREFLKEGIPVPFTPAIVKDHLWRPIQRAVLGVESTTQAKRLEYGQVYDVLNSYLINEKNIFVQWPSKDSM